MGDNDVSKELVQKAAAGDKAAFEELYQATCRSVYFTCLGLLKNEQEAQDITQDVYLTAFEQLGALEDAGKFKPWLYRIAANKSIKHLRKKQPVLPGDEQLEYLETEENENFLPEEYALNADKRELVLKITRKVCTDVQYQTILLYYFNELSIAEIAEIMECLEGTVKNRLSVARSKIKEGVLRYEKKSGDKLHSFAAIPFLTTMFTAQLQDMPMPSFSLSFLGKIPKSKLAAKAAKTGGRIMLKSLQVKIAVGIAAAVVAVGGIAAAVVLTNQDAVETSAEGQEGNTLDVVDVGNTEGTETSLETATPPTEEPEATAEPETETETPAETETPEPTVEPTTEPTVEPTELPAPTYTYTDMTATMYAKQTVNVRNLPSTDGNRLGGLSTNQEVAVSGQCNETGWYRIEYDGQTAYVSNNYLSDTKVEVAPSNSGGSNSSSDMEGIEQYPTYEWIDMGDWLLHLSPDGQNHFYSDVEGASARYNLLRNRYPNQSINGGWAILKDGTRADYETVEDPYPQALIDFLKKYYGPDHWMYN